MHTINQHTNKKNNKINRNYKNKSSLVYSNTFLLLIIQSKQISQNKTRFLLHTY